MLLTETIKDHMKQAMKQKKTGRVTTLRSLISAFQNELVATKRTPQDILLDNEAMVVIKREAKKRKDSIEQFLAGNREDLAQDEKVELAIIEEYLPEMMSTEAVRVLVLEVQKDLNVVNKSDMGKLMGAVIAKSEGRADGAEIKKIVDEILV